MRLIVYLVNLALAAALPQVTPNNATNITFPASPPAPPSPPALPTVYTTVTESVCVATPSGTLAVNVGNVPQEGSLPSAGDLRTIAPGPQATLQPAVHWDCDTKDLNNLKPVDNHQLYFTESGVANPDEEHQFASINANFGYPSVVLEHSAYVAGTQCQPKGLVITFTEKAAANVCQDSWPSQFVLVSSSCGCGAAGADNAHAYFLISAAEFDGLTATLQAAEIALEAAMTDLDLLWGKFQPSSSPSGGGSGPSSATPPSSSGTGGPGPNGGPGSFGSGGGSSGSPGPSSSGGPFGSGDGSSGSPGPSSSGGPGQSSPSAPGNSATPTPSNSPAGAFPTAPLGPNFDATLDGLLGNLNSSDLNSFLSAAAPGIGAINARSNDNMDLGENPSIVIRRRLQKRWSFKSLIQQVSSKIQTVVQQTVSIAKSAVSTAVNTVKQGVGAVVAAVSSLFNPSLDQTFNLNLAPSSLVDSPFGQAFQIFKKDKTNAADTVSGSIALYCVGCGVSGKAHISGQLSFSISKRFPSLD